MAIGQCSRSSFPTSSADSTATWPCSPRAAPTCGARRGKPCRTKTGGTANQPHGQRLAKIPTLRDEQVHFAVERPCPNCGSAEIARWIDRHRNKYVPGDRHIFECADCGHLPGYYDKPR